MPRCERNVADIPARTNCGQLQFSGSNMLPMSSRSASACSLNLGSVMPVWFPLVRLGGSVLVF